MLQPLAPPPLLTPIPAHAPRYAVDVRYQTQSVPAACPRALRALLVLMDMGAVMGGAACHFGGPSALAELASAVALCVQQNTYKLKNPNKGANNLRDGVGLHSSIKPTSIEPTSIKPTSIKPASIEPTSIKPTSKDPNKNDPHHHNTPKHYDQFHIINDAGHCENIFYALRANMGWGLSFEDLKLFRSISSSLTGHGESGLFPQGVYLSNGPLGSALPQAEGLALADMLQGLKRTTICFVSDGACMEGEAREALASIPGLAGQNKLNPFLLILSDNEKKLSGPMGEAFSMQPSFEALSSLGWRVKKLNAAHNLQACVDSLQSVLSSLDDRQPCVLWAKTTKGYGVKQDAESPSGGHGFRLKHPEQLGTMLKEIYAPHNVPDEFVKWQQALVESYSTHKALSQTRVNKHRTADPSIHIADNVLSQTQINKHHTAQPNTQPEKIQKGISRALIKLAPKYPIVSVSSDLSGSTGLVPFAKEFPQRAFDIGVAEANMVSVAAGLSKQGFIPVVDTFAQFGVTKGALPLTMANLSQAPVIAVLSHVGFQDAADGASHQALSYYAALSSIPGVQIFSLTCSTEAEALLQQAVDEFAYLRKKNKTPPSYVFFLGRELFAPAYCNPEVYDLRQAQVVLDNTASHKALCTVVAAGSLLPEALKAAETWQQQGLGSVVINPSCINVPDLTMLRLALKKTKYNLLTVEEHQITAGMGAMLVHALVQEGVPVRAYSLGVKGEFGQSAYKAHDLYVRHGLDAQSIAQAALDVFT